MSTIFRAAVPQPASTSELGPLENLPGTWMGTGFSLAELPDHEGGSPFFLRLNATQETLTFTEIGAPILNRGNLQDDIVFRGVHYLQQIADAQTGEALHVENGMWLYVPATSVPPSGPTLVRMADIPHGDSFMAQGAPVADVPGAPEIPPLDSTPNGSVFGDGYFPPPGTELPPGIPDEALRDPAVLLRRALKEQTVLNTTTLDVRTGPDDVRNIGFVVENANATSVRAALWIETVRRPDGTETLQLQYSQHSILRFPAGPRPDPAKQIDWPHIQVATLIKQ
ncbi:heme-binding protein [Nocardia sp. BMG51109]|uniref:heme-binding protein n=1 Tax=Nocardia sp. BMG51109 TaxID=1056816 RepID=UPI000463A2E3|nr:heme-binding protein [Nocardia sp. BMG51109]